MASNNDYFRFNNDGNIGLELRSGTTGGTPYIDFSNDASSNYDARILLSNNHVLGFFGNVRTGLYTVDGAGWHWITAGGGLGYEAWGFNPASKLVAVNSGGGWTKSFITDHPLDPENKNLVHATVEGPENAVFYRGKAQLRNGEIVVELPAYFEGLTREEGRTVLLTKIDGFDGIAIKTQDGQQIKDGKFIVYSENPHSTQRFNWEVKAIRADVEPLKVEVEKE
jgi:hypothetical protein